MFDIFLSDLALAAETPGLSWLIAAAFMAGLTRGFAGFGSGLVFMPFAGAMLPPAQAVAVVVVMDLIGSLANIPGAVRLARWQDLKWLGIALIPGVLAGLWLLFWIEPLVFRWGVSLLALSTVAALICGWQWRGRRGIPETMGVGFLAGIFGGATALPGPPVILFYLSSQLPVQVMRATMTIFMVSVDLLLGISLGLTGQIGSGLVALAVILLVPFGLGNAIGSFLFRPERVKIYKVGSWLVIGASALYGLPIWQG